MALNFATEIISADSRQFYKEMSIGTAKPSPEELQKVRHHFVDFISVTEEFTAGEFGIAVDKLLPNVFKDHDVCVMAGGSGLFIQAVCEGLDDIPEVPEEIRDKLNLEYEKNGIDQIRSQLRELDPEHYEVVDLQNSRRIIRALEVCLATGKPYSSFLQKTVKPKDYKIIKIGLEIERDQLYKKIEARVDVMIKNGLEEEVKSLVSFKDYNSLNSVGYREMLSFLEGNISLSETVELIKRNTRRFAKRQLTWFKRDEETKWFDPQDSVDIMDYVASQIDKSN